jgi:hypothetical protein
MYATAPAFLLRSASTPAVQPPLLAILNGRECQIAAPDVAAPAHACAVRLRNLLEEEGQKSSDEARALLKSSIAERKNDINQLLDSLE